MCCTRCRRCSPSRNWTSRSTSHYTRTRGDLDADSRPTLDRPPRTIRSTRPQLLSSSVSSRVLLKIEDLNRCLSHRGSTQPLPNPSQPRATRPVQVFLARKNFPGNGVAATDLHPTLVLGNSLRSQSELASGGGRCSCLPAPVEEADQPASRKRAQSMPSLRIFARNVCGLICNIAAAP
jgi:hypothetical protein